MGKVKGKHRLDKYYHLAKEHGYRSRAAWKLVQIDSKYNFLRSSRSVLDLCAAPGGWMQVAVERVPVGSLVIGVDLDNIRPIRGAIAAQEDITSTKCKATVKRLMAEHSGSRHGAKVFDLILHDGSPNVGGAWSKEATSQNSLVIDAVKLAVEFLAPKGTFVTKVFRSQDYTAVLYCLRQLFEKVEQDKPMASRSSSAEIYLVGLKYKAPAKIDPRLLDVKHLFEANNEPTKVVDVLRDTKQKRKRIGYEKDNTTLWKVSSAADFMSSNEPLDILGSVNAITFGDTESLAIKDHTLTTEEVRELCADLLRQEARLQASFEVRKWRMNMRKALAPAPKDTSTSEVQDVPKENEDDKVLNELEELTNAMDRKKKKAKKVIAKRRTKDKARKALGMQQDTIEDGYVDLELFSLSSIKGKKDLVAVDNNEFDDEVGEAASSDDEEKDGEDTLSSDVDSDEERKRYDELVEQLFDESYEHHLTKNEGSTKQRKRARESGDNELLNGADDENDLHSDQGSDNDQQDEVNPLVVPLEEDMPAQEEISKRWFNQDVFDEPEEKENLVKFDSDEEMQLDGPVAPLKKKTPVAPFERAIDLKKNSLKAVQKTKPSKAEDDLEIVPAPATDSSDSDSSSDDESDGDDIEKKAEVLAYAKKMLSKKQREEMLDDAYNKYMFHDTGLPKWFMDEEKKHQQPMKPITKEEVNAMKAQFKEIDARPAKKVAEAKARKKRATHRKLEKIRKKANSISDLADLSERSKGRMIEQLYKKATPQKPKKEYVVAKKGVQVKVGKGKVLVDRRMKSDARSRGAKKDQGKGKKGKSKGNTSAKKQGKFNKQGSKQGNRGK